MVIEISAQTRDDAQNPHSRFFWSIFVESDPMPNVKQAADRLKTYYDEDFDEHSIEITEWKEWDADAMRKGGIRVEKL